MANAIDPQIYRQTAEGRTQPADSRTAVGHRAGMGQRGTREEVPANAFTIDVEDYFQVQAFADAIAAEDWDAWPRRVEPNTERLLDMMGEAGVTGTFFILGWVAERHPDLVRRIADAGHEVASHGWAHVQVWRQTPDAFRIDVRRTRQLLEDLAAAPVLGYRAACFSIDAERFWAHRILLEEGYRYSSSVYPIRHDLYGMADAPASAFLPAGREGVVELPMTTVRALGRRWPLAGGGYFRLVPYAGYRAALRQALAAGESPAIFYSHPWEIDPDQPRPASLSRRTRFRHYVNLSRTAGRIGRLLRDFRWDRMDRVFAATIAAGAAGNLPGAGPPARPETD